MVRELREQEAIRTEVVAAAFASVPRHLFAPGEPLETAYAPHGTVVAKRDADGLVLSVMSAAHLQAVMLEQASVEPGMCVLEVGSGGYNAALLQEVVGPEGRVTTVDIDPDIITRARTCLDTAGYERVRTLTADAEFGVPQLAAFDRIVVTAAAWDIPSSWISQLTLDGRLVVPLRMRGLTRSVAFDRDGDGLVSRDYRLARFVPMQGRGAFTERKVLLREGVAIQTDDPAVRLDKQALDEALSGPALEVWPGAVWDFPDELELFAALNLPRVASIHASQRIIDEDVLGPAALLGVTILVTEDSFAYRAKRASGSTGEYESGVIAHGPQAESLAKQYAEVLLRWSDAYRRRGAATFRYRPDAAGLGPLPTDAVAKRHGTVTVTWS
ncbi:methyltransferase, FxLD system [Frankia sp. AgB1.9]|nr:methyltransferase, FxLD system [Frankia sp. AgW1.1]MBL7552798.1 methyltransferase, FxLD system [Frankia sp. AgB1.9]